MNENTKVHDLIIDINANERKRAVNSRTQFFTMDAKTGKMSVQFTRRGLLFDLTGATVLVGLHFVDKQASKVIDSEDGSVEMVDVVGGRCLIDIPSHVYGYEGNVMIHIYLKFENGQSLDCGVIATRFERSWLDEETDEMEKVYVERFENLARDIRERAEELNRLLNNVDHAIVSQADFDDQMAGLKNEVNNRWSVGNLAVSQLVVRHGVTASWGEVGTISLPSPFESSTELPAHGITAGPLPGVSVSVYAHSSIAPYVWLQSLQNGQLTYMMDRQGHQDRVTLVFTVVGVASNHNAFTPSISPTEVVAFESKIIELNSREEAEEYVEKLKEGVEADERGE